MAQANCEYCIYYEYDELYDCYTCGADLDQDELSRFITGDSGDCAYYRPGDEYTIVHKQN